MTLRFTAHARRRMAERGVTQEHIEDVLKRPIGPPAPGRRADTVIVSGHAEGVGILKVVVDVVDRDLVVSIFWKQD